MKLTVVGCAGSFPGPDSPASCYLVEAPHEGRTFRLVLDLGSGALGGLQRVVDLRDVDAVALSHLHADHCFDMAGFYVVSKFHPAGPQTPIPVFAPEGAGEYFKKASCVDELCGMAEQFDFRTWDASAIEQVGPFTVTTHRVDHPVPTYAMRIATADAVLVYSGDTGPIESLVDFVRGADEFLCEASFVESADNPPNLHLTGAEAGDIATRAGVGRLLVTHIPAWTDRREVESDVNSTWVGPVDMVQAGSVYDVGSR